jgi:hypothetical protein
MRKKLGMIIISKRLQLPPAKVPTIQKQQLQPSPSCSPKPMPVITVIKQQKPNCTVQNLQDYSRIDDTVRACSILQKYSTQKNRSNNENYTDENTTTSNEIYQHIIKELSKRKLNISQTSSPRLLKKRRTSYENKDSAIFQNTYLKDKMHNANCTIFNMDRYLPSETSTNKHSLFHVRHSSVPDAIPGFTCKEKNVFPNIHDSEEAKFLVKGYIPRIGDIKLNRKQWLHDLRSRVDSSNEDNKTMTIRLKDKAERNLAHTFNAAKINYLAKKIKTIKPRHEIGSVLSANKKCLSTQRRRSIEIKVSNKLIPILMTTIQGEIAFLSSMNLEGTTKSWPRESHLIVCTLLKKFNRTKQRYANAYP